MPGVPFLVQKREKRRKARRNNPSARLGLGCSAAASLTFLLVLVGLSLGYTALIRDLPSLQTIPSLLEPSEGVLLQPTRLYDRTGRQLILALENPAAAGREYLYVPASLNQEGRLEMPTEIQSFAAVPSLALIEATLALQDPGFWSHPGYLIQGLLQGEGYTLAQHLVSDLLLWDEPAGLRRSLRERLLAAQITAHFGRPRILEWHLNNTRYGPLVYGADAAARVYFNKPAARLTLAEAALLAAVGESPSLNPFSAPEIARERQEQVLSRMHTLGLIGPEEMQEALLQTLTYRAPLPLPENPAPAFTRLAIEQLGERFGLQRVERGGLVVITSLDLELQNQLNCTARAELERLKLGLAGHIRPGQEDCSAARLLPTMPYTADVSHLQLEANVIVMVPQSGQILALVGSAQPGLDPTRLPGHSPGSLYTPFIYLTAFTRGFSPASLVWDIPSSPETGLTGGEKYHGPVRLRTAFANDYLIPAAEVLAQVGPENAWRTMQQMGFASPSLEAVKSLPGAALPWTEGETTLLEAAQAFSVLANQGIMTGLAGSAPGSGQNLRPVTLLAVTDSSGASWMDCEEALVSCPLQARPVVSPQLAYLVTHVLSDETARWPSLGHPNPLEIGRPAAAKMGRTGGSRGTWVVGYAPQLVGGVWLGPASRDPGETEVSPQEDKALSSAAASLWHAVMQYSSRSLPPLAWSIPAGISPVDVCDPSGLLPTEYCPLVVAEVFLESSVPVHGDTLYREFSVNRETGRLATIFTPPGLVEDRVYLLPPPQAAAWAETAGLPLPPTSYDSIYAPAALSDSARIRGPEMFSHIHGQVRIEGSAQGEDFSFYRLQVGKGLNPREWFQIGEDSTRPVRSGLLGYWDTQGLSGLYALRLMVVSTDQRVETSIIQVTLDNQPPALEIVQPASGSHIVLSRKDRTVVFQARAADDTALKTIEFYLNGSLLAATAGEPYLIGWAGVPGTHALRVRAVDLAGNIQEAESIFTLTEE